MLSAFIFLSVCFPAFAVGANENFQGVASRFGSHTGGDRSVPSWATVTPFAGSVIALLLAQAGRGNRNPILGGFFSWMIPLRCAAWFAALFFVS